MLRFREQSDPEAFAALYDLYVKKIYRFVYFKVTSESDAEDITSDIFLKLWQYATSRGEEIRNFRALLYGIARNAVIDFYRTRVAHISTDVERIPEVAHPAVDPPSAALESGDKDELVRCIRALKEEYREIVVMRYLDGLGYGEIAEITGKSLINVRVTVHRALQVIKKMMRTNSS